MSGIRQSHAYLDVPSRHRKGLKIEHLLGLVPGGPCRSLLEVGCGSGGIAEYFALHSPIAFDVDAVDVMDNRSVTEGYRFHKLTGTQLPFEDDVFDVVISNHVIEHVGEHADQLHHLRELRRVLRRDGVCYLAVPNRWMLVEPHYGLAFLSWLPASLRSRYLKFRGKGDFYDCVPLEMGSLEGMLGDSGFSFRNACVDALYETLAIERPNGILRSLGLVPRWVWQRLRPVIPTLIYVLRKA